MFYRVVLPIVLPGLLSAALFAFLASFDELLIALFLSGVRAQTLPVRDLEQLKFSRSNQR